MHVHKHSASASVTPYSSQRTKSRKTNRLLQVGTRGQKAKYLSTLRLSINTRRPHPEGPKNSSEANQHCNRVLLARKNQVRDVERVLDEVEDRLGGRESVTSCESCNGDEEQFSSAQASRELDATAHLRDRRRDQRLS